MNAFPVNKYEGSWDDGMNLRDYFAAKAMQSLVKVVQDCITSPEEVSKLSYKYADAMMKARETK